MWSRSQSRASRPHQGKTQCRSRRITCSRIHGGGSCWSTASVRFRSSTGWMVALESLQPGPDQVEGGGAELLDLTDGRVAAEVGGEVGQGDVHVEVGLHRSPRHRAAVRGLVGEVEGALASGDDAEGLGLAGLVVVGVAEPAELLGDVADQRGGRRSGPAVSPAASSQEVPAKSPGRGWVRVTWCCDSAGLLLLGLLLRREPGRGEGDQPLDGREPEPVDAGGELLVHPPGRLEGQGAGVGGDPAGLVRRDLAGLDLRPQQRGTGAAGRGRRPSTTSPTGWRRPSPHRAPRPRTAPPPECRRRRGRRRSHRARADRRRPRSPYPTRRWPGAARTTGRRCRSLLQLHLTVEPLGLARRPRAGRRRRGPRPRSPLR